MLRRESLLMSAGEGADLDEENETLRAALDMVPLPIVLCRAGAVLWTNRAAQRMLDDGNGLSMAKGRLRADSRDDDLKLAGMLAAQSEERRSGPQWMRITRSGDAHLELMIRPVGRGSSHNVVFISDPERVATCSPEALRVLYGLSRAEQLVACELIAGASTREIGATLNVTGNTVRAHLKSLFLKTGTRRQTDLVRLLVSGVASE